jgi:hypothetical protein
MQRLGVVAVMAFLACLPVGCGGGSDGGGGSPAATGCDACASGEVCVSQLGGEEDTERCAPIPAACGEAASCADNTCVGALYDLCEAGWIGVGCSDTSPPTIVSCNPG